MIVGLGSIGKRHIRILKEILNSCSIFVLREKRKIKEKIAGVREYIFDWKDLQSINIDFAIVSNPSAFHIDTALMLAQKKIPFIVEKPVCVSMNRVSQLVRMVKDRNLPVLVGFNLRYHYLYKKIKEIITSNQMGRMSSFLAETGQYLPDWRDFDYTQSYSGYRVLGGGVIFDLTHEIDIAVDLLGEIDSVSCVTAKLSSLKIDTEDTAEITLIHKNNAISHIHLDYLQKEYTRKFKLIFEKGEIFWDYPLGNIKLTSKNKRVEFSQPENYTRDDTFKSQLKHWLDVLEGEQPPLVPLERGVYVSKIALCSHRSSEKRKWIRMR